MSLFDLSAALAQGTPPPSGGGMGSTVLILILMFAGMYFLVIAPQRKKQKEHDAKISSLKSGDRIVTNGGLYGTVVNVKNDRFIVKISDNTKVELAKQFVANVVSKEDEAKGEVAELKPDPAK